MSRLANVGRGLMASAGGGGGGGNFGGGSGGGNFGGGGGMGRNVDVPGAAMLRSASAPHFVSFVSHLRVRMAYTDILSEVQILRHCSHIKSCLCASVQYTTAHTCVSQIANGQGGY